jgi:Asp/Glu/hydantoin racemase
MPSHLALVHTVAGLVPTFEELVRRHLSGWTTFNLVDESLLRNTIREGRLTASTMRRVARHIWSAAEAGADAILVTCSSIGAAVDAARPFTDVPLVRVDEGMADQASDIGSRVGVIATLVTTLEPTRELVERMAAAKKRDVTVVAQVCEGAFDRLSAGDRERHDLLVAEGIERLAGEVDVVVLAQASMARAIDGERGSHIRVPVLSSPESGVLRLKRYLSPSPLSAK